jgi:hypothetical protein
LKEVETFIYKPTNQKITIKKNNQGNFECYCSDAGCPNKKKVYKTIESLKRHLKKVKSHWIGLSKVTLANIYGNTLMTSIIDWTDRSKST